MDLIVLRCETSLNPPLAWDDPIPNALADEPHPDETAESSSPFLPDGPRLNYERLKELNPISEMPEESEETAKLLAETRKPTHRTPPSCPTCAGMPIR